jgi:Matrixin
VKRVGALALAVVGAFLAGVVPTSAASNAWFKWQGTPKIALTIRVPQPGLFPSFQRAVSAWGLSPAFKLTIVQQTQCPALRQISVCNDPQGTETQANPAATAPTLVNGQGISATIWVYDSWVSAASVSELDYMACHELGHALGLAHQSVLDSCMSYAFARPFPNAQDYRSLGELYGLPPSTDPQVGAVATAPAPAPAPAPPSSHVCAPTPSTATGPAPDVLSYGDAGFYGSTGGVLLSRPIVGMAATPTGAGYWTAASDGGIFAFGDAKFHGSTGAIKLNQPIVGLARTPGGKGYWLVASDGGIFAFGDARFFGSTGNIRLNKPIVGMASTPSGNGYWMFASDGGVFAFGDAKFLGSLGAVALNKPILSASSSGSSTSPGYYMVASDGGVFTFGNAPFLGAAAATPGKPIVGMAALPAQPGGYWLVSSDGGVFSFGETARFLGSLGGKALAQPIVAIASRVPPVAP